MVYTSRFSYYCGKQYPVSRNLNISCYITNFHQIWRYCPPLYLPYPSSLGLGSFAILVLDISVEKYRDIAVFINAFGLIVLLGCFNLLH